MDTLNEVLKFNEQFVENKEYEAYETSGLPDKKVVILSCMDTRLVELLPRAMNLKNGDVKIVKNAGAVVTHPFDSIMRSLLIAVYELQAEEVWVIGHHDCGNGKVKPDQLIHKMEEHVTEEVVASLKHVGINLHSWLEGFKTVYDGVNDSVATIQNHPLLPKNTPVHGLVIDPATGKLERVTE